MEPMIEKLLGPVMVLMRISAFFLILPVFGWRTIPVRIKAAVTIIITIFFSMLIDFNLNASQISVLEAILRSYNRE